LTIRPRLNVICGRCGKRREGLRHVCRSNSRRRATIRVRPVLGGCSRCGKTYGGAAGNPLTHVCNPRAGEFRQRRAARQRKIRAAVTAKARAAERDRQRAKIAEARERERLRSAAQVARLKASYEKRLAAERARSKQQHKAPPRSKPRRPAHEYQSCADQDCQRPVCVAFKEGYRDGDRDGFKRGFEQGWQQGYAKGFPDGIAACPRAHQ
jgi:flagellar biosynthesis/type III secretory pathway protein FliH